jgi:hypothetical protein
MAARGAFVSDKANPTFGALIAALHLPGSAVGSRYTRNSRPFPQAAQSAAALGTAAVASKRCHNWDLRYRASVAGHSR